MGYGRVSSLYRVKLLLIRSWAIVRADNTNRYLNWSGELFLVRFTSLFIFLFAWADAVYGVQNGAAGRIVVSGKE